jgi:hypothetical protein
MITAARQGASPKTGNDDVEESDESLATRRRREKPKTRARMKVRFVLPEPAITIADQSIDLREVHQGARQPPDLDSGHDAVLKAFKHKISLLSSPSPPAAPPRPKASNSMFSNATSKDGWHRASARVVSGDPSAPANQAGAFPLRYSYLSESWECHVPPDIVAATQTRRVSDRVRGDDRGWSWF